MSLGKLLATGRSLVGGAPDAGRYNISSRNRLPKFGSAKNPFAPSATSEPRPANAGEQAIAPTGANGAAEPVKAPMLPAVQHDETQRIPELADQPVGPVRGFENVSAQDASWSGRLMTGVGLAASCLMWLGNKLLQFARGIKLGAVLAGCRPPANWIWTKAKLVSTKLAGLFRKPEPKSAIPRFGKPSAVQTELSLDRVRVVRNSLEDSDLEVVTAQTSTSAVVAPKAPVASPKRGPVPPALKKLTETLLSVKD